MKTPSLQQPMPCPRCQQRIDARARYCPHCGADTDAMLGPWLDVARKGLPLGGLLLLGLVVAGGVELATGQFPYLGWLSFSVGAGVVWWLRVRQAAPLTSYTTEPLLQITASPGYFQLTLTRATVCLTLTPTATLKQLQKIQYPLGDIVSVKYTPPALVFTYRKRQATAFEDLTYTDAQGQQFVALASFSPAAAREFVRQFNLIHLRVAPKP